MAPIVMERASELREFVGSLSELRDPCGVLSVTVGIEPGAGSGGTPPWEIAVENDLAHLRRSGSLGPAAKSRLDEASTHIAELLDPASGGRGRALYVPLESGERRELALQTALPTCARVGPAARVLPLLEALVEGTPAGVVMASKDLVVIFESELGRTSEVDRIELEPWVGDWWPEMKGPSRANPLRGQHAVSQRDRYSRRVAVAYRRTLHDATRALGALAAERRWTRAVLAGDPRTADALGDALRSNGVLTIALAANLEGMRLDEALERLGETLGRLAVETSVQRVRAAQEEAAAGAKGARGLAGVLRALNEARVATLLIDSGRTHGGLVEPAGTFRVTDPGEDGADLTDLIVERALSTGAEVVPVHGVAAEQLESCDGIVAHLRW